MSRFDYHGEAHRALENTPAAERYGKQVAVRFDTEELKQLDELVAAKAKVQHYPRVTRSSTVIHLVTAAHNKLLNDRRRGGAEPLPSGDPAVAELPEWQRELERKPVRQTRRRVRQTKAAARKTKAKKKKNRKAKK